MAEGYGELDRDSSEELKREALEQLEKGNQSHLQGDTDTAIDFYMDSIRLFPTADAHTYLGWMFSFQGRTEEAIEECHIAISLDPDFGNPYNDIGVYLIDLDRHDEAIPWLVRAKSARRYDPRHFPYLNLGRVFMHKKEYGKAFAEFRGALQLAPGDLQALGAARELQGLLN